MLAAVLSQRVVLQGHNKKHYDHMQQIDLSFTEIQQNIIHLPYPKTQMFLHLEIYFKCYDGRHCFLIISTYSVYINWIDRHRSQICMWTKLAVGLSLVKAWPNESVTPLTDNIPFLRNPSPQSKNVSMETNP